MYQKEGCWDFSLLLGGHGEKHGAQFVTVPQGLSVSPVALRIPRARVTLKPGAGRRHILAAQWIERRAKDGLCLAPSTAPLSHTSLCRILTVVRPSVFSRKLWLPPHQLLIRSQRTVFLPGEGAPKDNARYARAVG